MAYAELSLLEQLATNSSPYHDPLLRLNWDALDTAAYWLPPTAISLFGTCEYEELAENTRIRLSQYEFTGFIQAGLWLEAIFVERLSRNLKHTQSAQELAYYLHEIREESGHSLMFLKLMEKSGLRLPGVWRNRPRTADFLGRHAPINTTLFWLAVTIGEEVPDKLNRYVRTHGSDCVDPLIRQMCTLHVIDEARHIAHARSALERSLVRTSSLHKKLLTPVINVLIRQFVTTFYLPQADVYELAGLNPGHQWREIARHNPARREFIQSCLNPSLNLLRGHGFTVKDPVL
ncbi:MAG: diiron oxygenase [Sulfuriferula sp.]